MDEDQIKVLLIEDNPGDVRLIREILAEVRGASFYLECADRLQVGLDHLATGGIDVVLLDLGLPNSQGLDTFIRVHDQAPEVPVVVLTGLDNEDLAVKALRKGAQDYLVKGEVNSNLLSRSMHYAIERHRMQTELRNLAFYDELTGLYNRREFLILAEHHLKLAGRTMKELLLGSADLDGLKKINDTFGHREGDLALIETAKILKESFRQTDIVARIGGDEFAVMMIEARRDSAEILTTRLQKKLEAHNAKGNRRYKLSISMGIAYYDPKCPCSIDELLNRADKLMYEEKRSKKKS